MSLHDSAAARPNGAGYKDVAVTDVPTPAPQGLQLIDVREPHEYSGELGHIKGAQLVPMGTLPAVAQAWKRDDEYLLICKSGGRSGSMAALMRGMGFSKVMNMTGGMLAWNAAGRSTEK